MLTDRRPRPGDLATVRHRQYLVDEVAQPTGARDEHTLVRLTCLDDDAQGRALSVLWERELGARVIEPARTGLGTPAKLDEPRRFAAYLHALKWSSVTATDSRLFQAPFRAGIHLLDHQLVPLKKALELPRVNLFIADDVGLGKTIEAGLVMQELMLRQRVDRVLIVCPASVTLQWREELERRFGLRFEIFNRDFVARRRQERGFSTPIWATHHRFIVSYETLRRPENYEPLLAVLGSGVLHKSRWCSTRRTRSRQPLRAATRSTPRARRASARSPSTSSTASFSPPHRTTGTATASRRSSRCSTLSDSRAARRCVSPSCNRSWCAGSRATSVHWARPRSTPSAKCSRVASRTTTANGK